WGLEAPLDQLIFLSLLTLVIWILESVFEYLLIVRWRGLAQDLQHEFRIDGYQHLQKLDMAQFEDRSTGGLVTVLNDDVNQLERFFNEGMNNLIQLLTSVILIGAVFFYIAPQVAVFAFVPMPLIILGAFYFQKRAAPLYLEVRDQAGLVAARLSNNIGGIATIRSFAAESHESARLRAESESYLEANRRAIEVSARFNPLIRMAVLLGFLLTFIVGGALTLRGELNVGSYGVLVFLSQRLLWPLRDLAATVDLFERAMASADRVLNLLSIPIQLETPRPHAAPFPGTSSGLSSTTVSTPALAAVSAAVDVDLKDVSFTYGNDVPVLRSVSLHIPAGQTIAIVGPTGSGKSTVTKLLLRFYEPTQGQIRIGGVDLAGLDPQDLRRHIGLVSQDVFLFHGTIFENISYGRPGATRDDVMAAARQAHADEFIAKLPRGLDTLIGERGQKLSGGQRQRLSIARVILKNPPVLILDEATSAVDNETEALIQKSLNQIVKGRTTIVIAHRLSTVVHADRIYVLADGRIQDEGTHEELLRKGSMYAQMWKLQVRHSPESSVS
ncbi:MAG: ABC transporter ATP-binding protein, partial [Bdellovibrionales bacterium]